MWIVLGVVALSAVGLGLLLLPRFTPRTPRWAEAFVPPRYRRRAGTASEAVTASAASPAVAAAPVERTPETVPAREPGPHRKLNGSTALSERAARTRTQERERA
jgi:UDP-GlcNAc:undecaprenyl-phosphate GlcNAc-1-phosphate transferase